MMIKDKLSEIATKYKVTLTYQENAAEFTGFQDTFAGKCIKSNLRSDMEELLISQGYKEFTTKTWIDPHKITVSWRQE
jgi:hypothetical protein